MRSSLLAAHQSWRLARRLCGASSACPHASTLRWVDEVIIGKNLCPYTKAVRRREPALRTIICAPSSDEALLDELDCEVHALAAGGGPETSLLVLSPSTSWGQNLHDDFAKFLSLGWKVEDRLAELAPTTLQLQLAMFHPLAVRNMYTSFEEEAADYAMRAPHPTLHLLRVADVEALAPGAAALVPERNRATLDELGVEKLREMFAGL